MKGNRNPPPKPPASSAAPLSPTSKPTAKYTNKDGSKFITVPKTSTTTPADSSQPSPTTASPPPAPAPTVNRKKQKRRQKLAAKLAAEQLARGVQEQPVNGFGSSHDQQSAEAEVDHEEEDQDHEGSSVDQQEHPSQNGSVHAPSGKQKKHKKKKKKAGSGGNPDGNASFDEARDGAFHDVYDHSHSRGAHVMAHQHKHTTRSGMSREKIWNTSSQEERERIKEFWLGLNENERKSLVKVEKDAVLKKMKEQQKQTCSCSVCGRKRTAIEEELEGLYDAYYEELEQYANHPNSGDGPPMLGPRPHSFGSMNALRGRGLHASRYTNHNYHHQPHPPRGRIVEHDEEGDEDEDEYSDGEPVEGEEEDDDREDDDNDYSDVDPEPSEDLHRPDYAADFFKFGNSLTVQGRDRLPILPSFLQSSPSTGTGNNAYGSSSLGGILTVADDLLKNDGRKFIEMMEQLAERRMAREEDAREQYEQGYEHANGNRYAHSNHAQPPEEEEFEDEEDVYEEDEEDGFEEDDQEEEEDPMTDEQRMEEGRRMFQIFAARMFEQRVLTAYREKVAKERQNKLLEELEFEQQQEEQRKAKKAKEAQRRKDRAARKKEALAEEKARKESEKAAEEAARRAEEQRKAEEQRQKAEEKRKKKEALKKAEEEERQRKEAERVRKIHEREEAERKAREAKEREKKAREEARQKEKEAREQKEREARERREQQQREKREREAKAKAEQENRAQAKEAKEKKKKEERAAQKAAALAAATVAAPVSLPKRPAQPSTPAAPALAQPSTSYASPQIKVATPALPKALLTVRPPHATQQENPTSSVSGASNQPVTAPNHNPSPVPITPVHASPGPIGPPSKSGPMGSNIFGGSGPSLLSHSASPMNMPAKVFQPMPQPTMMNPFGGPPLTGGMPFPPPGLGQVPPVFNNPMHRDPPFSPMTGFRPPPGIGPLPPGLSPNANRFPMHHPPPGFPGAGLESPVLSMSHMMGSGMQQDAMSPHSRQGSGSYESGVSQPVPRPTPIGRPASVVHGQRRSSQSPPSGPPKPGVDTHLGSSALLADSDDVPDFSGRSLPGPPPVTRPGPRFPTAPFGTDPIFHGLHNVWAPPGMPHQNPFAPGPPPGFGGSPIGGPSPISSTWGPLSQPSSFSGHGVMDRPLEARSITVRKMLRRACQELSHVDFGTEGMTGFIPLKQIKTQMAHVKMSPPIGDQEILEICETEGNELNGGGIFEVREDSMQGETSIQFVLNNNRARPQGDLKIVGYHPGSPTSGLSSSHHGGSSS
ncbi:salt tolerance down-regulator-domain-containing protein [Podospora australis]|uniref:Stress response protein NST1 n=1 Tax=Podospora australis TaxID=1536484 RepID=A0AAN6X0R0_9PEZI|nr:salt tolerance down-regulator-domain-containing protein [Podospora australis]